MFQKKKDLWVPQWARDAGPARPAVGEEIVRRMQLRDAAAAAGVAADRQTRELQAVLARQAPPGAGAFVANRKGARGVGSGRLRSPMRLPVHTAPSRMLKSIYPWITDPGLGINGAYIGVDLFSMSSFLFDIWELYPSIITSPNMFLMGVLGAGKSALQKCLILRMLVFGIRFSWVQLKPEYDELCAAIGVLPLRIGPGQLVRLNPLAEIRRHPDQTYAEWVNSNRVRRITLTQGLLRASSGRPLSDMDESVIGWALDSVTGQHDPTREQLAPVSLPTLLVAMVNPERWADRAEAAGETIATAMEGSRQARLRLDALVNGSLRGMFDSTEARNTAFDLQAPGTLLDLSAVRSNNDLTVLAMVCGQSAMEAELMHPDAGRRLVGYDEAWKAMQFLDLLRRMQEQWKLARMYGIANLLAFHRFSDLDAVGESGSEARALAHGLLKDSGVKISYRQEADALPATQDLMELSNVETDLLRYLKRGVAMWKVGKRTFVVKHLMTAMEHQLTYTDSKMKIVRGIDDIDDGDWEDIMETWVAQSASPTAGAGAVGAGAP
jgi:type IV secretory pathway VirB4 component